MSMVSIEVLAFSDQRLSVTLDGIVYQIVIRRNGRTGRWSIDWYDAENNPLIMGMRLVPQYDSLESYARADAPHGQLWAVDPTGENTEIPEEFSPFELVYVEAV